MLYLNDDQTSARIYNDTYIYILSINVRTEEAMLNQHFMLYLIDDLFKTNYV